MKGKTDQMKTWKSWITIIRDSIRTAQAYLSRYLKRNFGKTEKGVYFAALLTICFLSGLAMAQLFPQTIPSFLVGCLLAFVLFHLAIVILSWLIRQILRLGIRNLIYMALILSISVMLALSGNLGYSQDSSMIVGALFGVVIIWFVKALWACFHNRVHTPTIILSLLVSGVIFVAGCILLIGNGFENDYVQRYLQQNPQVQQAGTVAGFKAQLQKGDYTVESLEYSPLQGSELESDTIDLSFCVENPGGWNGLRRKLFFDYDIKKAAIAGKVWYPKEGSDCPVVFLVHGNHSILEESYLGYGYLGEYLASHGYVVVSVDENVLNGLIHENDARAILLLENIKELQQYNRQQDNPLYGKMDYGNIALAGHSRGGEAVATACLFNQYDAYPENGMHAFDYHFAIRSVIAIAPTVDQYMPADHEVELCDVNYLQLQGANDQDVSQNMGNTQYSHVTFSGEGNYLKSSLYIAGANHGQFNSLWGQFDLPQPIASFLNVADFLSEKEQQDILEIYAKTFLDLTLRQDSTYADLLRDYAKYSSDLPETLYIQQYQQSDAEVICNYEEDSDIQTASKDTVTLDADGMRSWTEEMSHYSDVDTEPRKNYVLHLSWKDRADASYQMTFHQAVDLKGKSIALDICDLAENSDADNENAMLDVLLQVTDVNGNTAYLDTAGKTTIYPALPVKLAKLQYLTGGKVYKHEYQTICAPLSEFIPESNTIDMAQIRKITIAFPNNEDGKAGIDNICIESFSDNAD